MGGGGRGRREGGGRGKEMLVVSCIAHVCPHYLVGVSTSANRRVGVSSRAWRMGRAKAPVLPDPVSARPMMSLPGQGKKGEGLAAGCGKER